MIITLVYHRIHSPSEGLYFVNFKQHLEQILECYPIIIPGEKTGYKTCVCLTFDDAYFDFYHYVFPMLKKHNIKAVISIPTAYIESTSLLSASDRLAFKGIDSWMSRDNIAKSALCTWQELQEMAQSDHVILASHSHNHPDLTKITNIEGELINSKDLIKSQTGSDPQIFIYPYGKTNSHCRDLVNKHYKHSMRIGTAINFNWNKLTYRICATKMSQDGNAFGLHNQARWLFNYCGNKFRNC